MSRAFSLAGFEVTLIGRFWVTTEAVYEFLDALKQIFEVAVLASVDHFPFENLDKALARGVVIWIRWPAHTRQDLMLPEPSFSFHLATPFPQSVHDLVDAVQNGVAVVISLLPRSHSS